VNNADDIREQAARWVTRVDSDQLSVEQRLAFDTWLHADPRHHASYVSQLRLWKRLDQLAKLRGCEPWAAQKREPFRERHRMLVRNASLAAGLAAVATVSFLVWHSLSGSGWSTYRTGRGALQDVTLVDGTKVLLNTDTEVEARITGSQRTVHIVRGEALFKVIHDKRPFMVRVGEYAIRDLGTEFSVRLREDSRVDILMRDGRVEVDRVTLGPDGRVISLTRVAELSAGDALTLNAGGGHLSHLLPREEVDRRLAWTTGHLVFAGETVEDALAEFNRYNLRQLRVSDAGVAGWHVGGRFVTTDPQGFVSVLERMYPLRAVVAKDSGNVMLVRRDAH
jgi:transmembrane sensor